jgi:hypothetical protein
VLIQLAIVVLVVRAVRRPARLRPLYQDFLARGYVARIHHIGMTATRQDTNFSTALAVMQGPNLDDAQFEATATQVSEVVAGLNKQQKQTVSNAFFLGGKSDTRCADAPDTFLGAPARLLLVTANFKERRAVYIPGRPGSTRTFTQFADAGIWGRGGSRGRVDAKDDKSSPPAGRLQGLRRLAPPHSDATLALHAVDRG